MSYVIPFPTKYSLFHAPFYLKGQPNQSPILSAELYRLDLYCNDVTVTNYSDTITITPLL